LQRIARARTRDERRALLSALPSLLIKLGKSRIDALERDYDAAHGQARRALERALRGAKRRPGGKQLRARFEDAAAALKRDFSADAAEEAESVRRLQATIMSGIALTKDELAGGLEGWAEISWAFAEWSWEARWRKLAREQRLSAWLARQTTAAPKPRRAVRTMLDRAERAVSGMKADEDQFRKQAADERSLIAEWSRRVAAARAAEAPDLAAEAESRVAQHAAIVHELDTEIAAAASSRERLERSLGDIRTRVAAR